MPQHPSCANCVNPSPVRVPAMIGDRVYQVCPGCAKALRGGLEEAITAGPSEANSTNYARSSRRGGLDWLDQHSE